MWQLFVLFPWLAACALTAGVIVACVAIVFVTDYLRTSRQSEIDAWLKQDMLNRGMSAGDIKTVLEARSDGEARRQCANQEVRVGLGKLQVKVGAMNEPASQSVQV
jgi:hypothetical protein